MSKAPPVRRSKLQARLELKGADLHWEICRMWELQLLTVTKLARLEMRSERDRTLVREIADLLIRHDKGTRIVKKIRKGAPRR